MKILCPWGHSIRDPYECGPDKAYLLPDRDYFAIVEEVANDTRRWQAFEEAQTTVWQCGSCGRLVLYRPCVGQMLWFAPEGHRRRVLGSVQRDRFKIRLEASWASGSDAGELWWGEAGEYPAGYEQFSDWDALERRYFVVLECLHSEGRLRWARLSKRGEIMHRWPEDRLRVIPGSDVPGLC
jgi:hypothetical protein